jgi:hypothetical protein
MSAFHELTASLGLHIANLQTLEFRVGSTTTYLISFERQVRTTDQTLLTLVLKVKQAKAPFLEVEIHEVTGKDHAFLYEWLTKNLISMSRVYSKL